MNTILLDGKRLREIKYVELKTRVAALKEKQIQPHLAVVQVGSNPASTLYVGNKVKACEALGIKSTRINLDEKISWEELVAQVEKLNNDKDVDGILIQLPLPAHLAHYPVSTIVDPKKDADGIHPYNQGLHLTKTNVWAPYPCTPNGVMEFFKEYNISLEGKKAVVLGRSNIVGRPMAYMLANADATVSQVHAKTKREDVEELLKDADIIVSATGSVDVFKPHHVKRGVVIVDVGMIKKEDGKFRGDVDHKEFMGIASHITPVPGGVGVMTVTMLMENVIALAEKYKGGK